MYNIFFINMINATTDLNVLLIKPDRNSRTDELFDIRPGLSVNQKVGNL